MRVRFRCPPELEDILPRPFPAKRGLPDWLRDMAMTAADADLGGAVRTVKQCPPFVDAMAFGFMIPLAADVAYRDGQLHWDWDLPSSLPGRTSRSPLGFHVNSQALGTPYFEDDRFLVKFNNFWTIELEPGCSLLATHPVNRDDLPFRTLTGLVDADLYKDAFIQFPAAWVDQDFAGVLAKGTPIAQCFVVSRERLDLDFGAMKGADVDRYVAASEAVSTEPGTYRKRFRAKKP